MRRFAGVPASILSLSSHEQVDDRLGRKDEGIGLGNGEFIAALCRHARYEGFQRIDGRHVIVGVRVNKGFIDRIELGVKAGRDTFCQVQGDHVGDEIRYQFGRLGDQGDENISSAVGVGRTEVAGNAIAFFKKRKAALVSRVAVKRKSIVRPCLSTAR